jgi:uncharacterized membrane protein YhaH (DUF805 family)
VSWYLEVLRKYAQFDGRARRKEYWMFALINIVISIGLGMVGGMLGIGDSTGMNMLAAIYALAVLIPSIAVGIRRLHDVGRSGWWTFVVLVPIIGAIALLIWAVQDSDPGSNEYGPNPKTAIA